MPATVKTEKSWFLVLFGLPFFCIGAGFLLFSVAPTLFDAWRMAAWNETQGTLLQAQLVADNSGDSTTYRVTAEYRYRVGERSYRHHRVAIGDSADNVGDFQQTLGKRLERAWRNEQPVSVWYDPENPQDAVLNRDLRWGLLGFKLIFVVLFGGVGSALIYFGSRGIKTVNSPETAVKPWLQRPEWHSGIIASGAKTGMYAAWSITLLWNLLSTPAAVFVPDIWREKGALALLVLIFPLIGLCLLYWALKTTLEWRRFGATPMTMDPFPGAIGGDVGGEITINTPYHPAAAFAVTLSCIHSYQSGSGEDRSRSEKAVWQDSGYAEVQSAMRGVRLHYRFEVPDGLPASDAQRNDNYHFWRLDVHGDLPGVDLQRSFDIPVYRSAEKSRRITTLSARHRPAGGAEIDAEALLPLIRTGSRIDIHYRMLRKPLSALGILLFGGIFSGSGAFLWHQAAHEGFMLYLMSAIFHFVGGLIVLWGLYALFNSLHVCCDGRTLYSSRHLFGIPVSAKKSPYPHVRAIAVKQNGSSQSGNTHRVHYQVVAKTDSGDLVLAEELDAHSKAEKVAEYFRHLGMG
ncbi:MAG: DUF3592 domain-containing protein [Gammaproteobacteria bacterium]